MKSLKKGKKVKTNKTCQNPDVHVKSDTFKHLYYGGVSFLMTRRPWRYLVHNTVENCTGAKGNAALQNLSKCQNLDS